MLQCTENKHASIYYMKESLLVKVLGILTLNYHRKSKIVEQSHLVTRFYKL